MSANTGPLPCPGCRKPPMVYSIFGDVDYAVTCSKWDCMEPLYAEGKTREGAIRTWNRKVRKASNEKHGQH